MRTHNTDKLRPTAFDMVAAALSPSLIIGMIASLVFFLVIAFYRGQYDLRLMYILGLYTLATVLIARIAIESGRAHASAFGVPLAVVAIIAMFRFVTVPGGLEIVGWALNIGLLALVWFLADRITFDCTLLEEDRESVQGGLLQTLGVPEDVRSPSEPAPKSAPTVELSKRAKHNPGVWVLYFALLAFPLFGLGQLAIPDPAERNRAFWMLVAYLGCALGLLATTSLLALRRYLRQRNVEMPTEITTRWLMAGAGVAIAVLLVCMLLPLPGRSLGLIGLPFEITSLDNLAPSRFGFGSDGQQNESYGEPRPEPQSSEQDAAAQAPDAQPGGEGPQGDQPPPAGEGQGDQGQRDQGQRDQGQPGRESQRQSDAQKPGESSPRESSQPSDSSERSDAAKPSAQENSRRNDRQRPESEDQRSQPEGQRHDRQAKPQPDEAAPQDSESGASAQHRAVSQQPQQQQQQQQQQQRPSQPPASGSPGNSLLEQLSQLGGSIGQWFKWLTIALLAAIVLLYALTHPREIVTLWRNLLDFLAMLFGGKRRQRAQADSVAEASAVAARRPRFAAFANPFAHNLRGWQAAHVIEHTFAALEAWAAEHGHARQADQTAEEFARRLAAHVPQLGKLPIVAAGMLDRVMFAGWQVALSDLTPLRELWQRMESLAFFTAEDAEIVEKAH